MARELIDRGSQVPDSYEELLKLPGIGPYAASAYLSLHRNQRAVLIDANIVRWLCRLLGRAMDGETRREAWVSHLASRLTPPIGFRDYNYAALDFTMKVCAQTAHCEICPLIPFCRTGHRWFKRSRHSSSVSNGSGSAERKHAPEAGQTGAAGG